MVICTQASYSAEPNCAPDETLTIRGQRFPVGGAVTVYLTTNPNRWGPSATVNVSCAASAIVDANPLTCVVPRIDPEIAPYFYGMPNLVVASFPGLQLMTNSLASFIVAYPDMPVLTSVSGCEVSNGSLMVQRCRGGDVLTIQGMKLNCTNALLYGAGAGEPRALNCTFLPQWTPTEVRCQLLNITEETAGYVLADVGYAMTWVPPKLDSYSTTIVKRFSMSWTWDPPPKPQIPQSDEAGGWLGEGVVAAAVVVPLVCWRRCSQPG